MDKKKRKEKKAFETPEDFDEFMSEKPVEEEPPEDDEKEDDVAPDKEADVIPDDDEDAHDDMLDVAADVPVQVVAVMGKRNITIKEMAGLKMGEVIELNRPANEIVDLVAGGKLIAKGELVEIEGKLGVRIVKIMR